MKNEAKKTAKTEAAESKKALAVDASEAVKKAALPAPPQSQEVVQALWKKAQAAKAAAEAEKARQAYKEATQAAKGYGPGSGGRCKGAMSGVDAAVKVLRESKEALQVGTICNKAIELGLWNPEGQTPSATLSVAIQKEVKKGEASRIVKVRQGYFAARKPEAAPQA